MDCILPDVRTRRPESVPLGPEHRRAPGHTREPEARSSGRTVESLDEHCYIHARNVRRLQECRSLGAGRCRRNMPDSTKRFVVVASNRTPPISEEFIRFLATHDEFAAITERTLGTFLEEASRVHRGREQVATVQVIPQA